MFAQKFPDAFVGHWKGSLDVYDGPKKVETVTYRLDVAVADSGRYSWVVSYGDSGDDVRPYLLIPIDTAKGRWALDQQNGVVIDMFVNGHKFSILTSTMFNASLISYWIEGEELLIEEYVFPESPGKTVVNQKTSYKTKVNKFYSYHFGRLQKTTE